MNMRDGVREGIRDGINRSLSPGHPVDAAGWADLVGWTEGNVEHAYAFGGGDVVENVADQIGSADIDVWDLQGTSNDLTWPGTLGGKCYGYVDGLAGFDSGSIETTTVGVLSPGEDDHSWYLNWARGDRNDLVLSANRQVFDTNGIDEGLRLFFRNHVTSSYWLYPVWEQQANIARGCQLTTGPGEPMHMLGTRNGLVIEVWAAAEGSGDVVHEDNALTAGDDFDGAGPLKFGSGGSGKMLDETLVKQFVFAREGSDQDQFEILMGTPITSVTEA